MKRGLYFSKAARVAACTTAILAMVVAVAPPAQASTTANLLKNPGAEAGTGTNLHGWAHTTGTTLAAAKYGSAKGFPTQGSPGPSNRGKNFFVGGKDAAFSNEVAVQNISLSKYVSKIKGGKVKLNVGGWFGGFANQNDTAGIEVDFTDANGHLVGSGVSIGFPTAADRHNKTGLINYLLIPKAVPKGARKLYVQLILERAGGDFNNGYADNLSVSLSGV